MPGIKGFNRKPLCHVPFPSLLQPLRNPARSSPEPSFIHSFGKQDIITPRQKFPYYFFPLMPSWISLRPFRLFYQRHNPTPKKAQTGFISSPRIRFNPLQGNICLLPARESKKSVLKGFKKVHHLPRHIPLPGFNPSPSVRSSRNRYCFARPWEEPWATHGKSKPSAMLQAYPCPEPTLLKFYWYKYFTG
jgi:hypothetical protein